MRNQIDIDDIISIFFTVTEDLDAEDPALAAPGRAAQAGSRIVYERPAIAILGTWGTISLLPDGESVGVIYPVDWKINGEPAPRTIVTYGIDLPIDTSHLCLPLPPGIAIPSSWLPA